MKQLTSFLLVGLTVLMLATSCDFSSLKPKGIPEDKKAYIGVWTNEEVYLEITENGTISYERQTGTTKTSLNGPIQKFSGNSFEAGALGFNKLFKVSSPPHEVNATWVMVVDGRELMRE